jgi:hypothetical protein
MSLILRNTKGSPLTYTEMDNNLIYLQSLVTAGSTGASGPAGPSGPSGPAGPAGPTGPFSPGPSVQTITSSSTVTPTDSDDVVVITAQAVSLTLANPTGSWVQGKDLLIRIKDNGISITIAYGTNYRPIGVSLPAFTTSNKTIYLGIVYNSTDSKWDVIGVSIEI